MSYRSVGTFAWYDAEFDRWMADNAPLAISPDMVKPEIGFRWVVRTAPRGWWDRLRWCLRTAWRMWKAASWEARKR